MIIFKKIINEIVACLHTTRNLKIIIFICDLNTFTCNHKENELIF